MTSKSTGIHLMEEEEKVKMQVLRSLFVFDSTPSKLSPARNSYCWPVELVFDVSHQLPGLAT